MRCFFDLFEPLFRLGQRWLGLSRLGWLFVAPNLLVFGLFTFLPILINLVYALTGGVNLQPLQRPWTGGENFQILFECGNYLDLSTCRKDVFWRAIGNTLKFSVLQVVLMVLLSLVTALVLNRKIIGRGFWRGVYFYPVLLSPVVVALVWKWILQRDGVLNAALVAAGLARRGQRHRRNGRCGEGARDPARRCAVAFQFEVVHRQRRGHRHFDDVFYSRLFQFPHCEEGGEWGLASKALFFSS